MFVAEIGEPPDISQADSIAEAGEKEVALIIPGPSIWFLLLLNVRHVLLSLAFTHPPDKIAWEQEQCDARVD